MTALGRQLDACAMRFLDIALASAGLAAVWPILLGGAAVSAVFVGLPPWYVSRRVGRHGREYRHVKLRTMLPGPEIGRVFFEQDRLNRAGRLLRRTHVDELPELLLILWGRMSFVGPRPLPRRLLEGLDARKRESVRPGWTGLAQLHLLAHGKLDKHAQIALDEAYVASRSLVTNVRILGATLRLAVRPAPLDLDPGATADRRAFGAR